MQLLCCNTGDRACFPSAGGAPGESAFSPSDGGSFLSVTEAPGASACFSSDGGGVRGRPCLPSDGGVAGGRACSPTDGMVARERTCLPSDERAGGERAGPPSDGGVAGERACFPSDGGIAGERARHPLPEKKLEFVFVATLVEKEPSECVLISYLKSLLDQFGIIGSLPLRSLTFQPSRTRSKSWSAISRHAFHLFYCAPHSTHADINGITNTLFPLRYNVMTSLRVRFVGRFTPVGTRVPIYLPG